MQEVFEKIIEELEENQTIVFNLGGGKPKQSIDLERAIEIVKKEAKECNSGHFGCNTNGEHKKCNGCGLTNCKSRNKIWFCAMDDGTDTNDGSNGWISVEEELPKTDEYILLSFSNFSIPLVGRYEEDENGGAFYVGDENETCISQDMFVNAWMNLPDPYQTKGE